MIIWILPLTARTSGAQLLSRVPHYYREGDYKIWNSWSHLRVLEAKQKYYRGPEMTKSNVHVDCYV